MLFLVAASGRAGDATPTPEPPPYEAPVSDYPITLTAMVQAGRIILLWTPPNTAPSSGMKIERALEAGFSPDSVDQYTKWLPGTGYTQCVLFPSAASDKDFYYRVSSVETGLQAVCLAMSNPVRIEAMKERTKGKSNEELLLEEEDWTSP